MSKKKILSGISDALSVLNLLEQSGVPVDRLIGKTKIQGPRLRLVGSILAGDEIDPLEYPTIFRFKRKDVVPIDN